MTLHPSPAPVLAPPDRPWYDDVWAERDHRVGVRVFGDLHVGGRVLVWAHGGSWVGGSVEGWHPVLAALAARLGETVVGVRYRLAGQAPHPAPTEDVVAAVRTARRVVTATGRVLVGGDSAGGTLAAAAALQAPRALDGQLLLYPPMDPTCSAAALRAVDAFPDRTWMRQAWASYAGPAATSHPELTPMHSAVPADVPPASVVVGAKDPMREESLAYAARLGRAGATVRTVVLPQARHGDFLKHAGPGPSSLRTTVATETLRLFGEAS